MKPFLISVMFLCLAFVSAGCSAYFIPQPAAAPELPTPIFSVTSTPTVTNTPFQPLRFTPTEPFTPTPTSSPTPIPSPTWARFSGGELEVPILLYHHIGESKTGSPYFVSPEKFRMQMESLHDWGYTTITMTTFAKTLLEGGLLPERPVVITFDDGYRDVYDHAFPIMQELGFVGVFYLVSNNIYGGSFVNVDQVKEMIAAGWEIGNHSANHRALTQGYSAKLAQTEIIQSQMDLEKLLGAPITTFSYPFGLASEPLKQQLKELGYLSAVGVGVTKRHSVRSIYFLGRSEVRGNFTLEDFAALLPWSGD